MENHRERMRSSHTVYVCVCAQSEWITRRLAHTLSKIWPPVKLTTHSANHRHRMKTTKPRKEAVSTSRTGEGCPEPPQTITKDTHKTPRLLASLLQIAAGTLNIKVGLRFFFFLTWYQGNTMFLDKYHGLSVFGVQFNCNYCCS